MAVQEGRPTYLLLESPVTKRKEISFVLNEAENPLYASASVAELFDWLISQEATSIIVCTKTRKITVSITNVVRE